MHMAVLEGLGFEEQVVTDEALVAGLFDAAIESLGLLPTSDQIRLASRYERHLESTRLLAAARSGRGDHKRTKAALADVGRSQRIQNRDARRAVSVANNEALADQVAAGRIDAESVDALARAADDSGAIPESLIADVIGTGPDQATRIVSDHIAASTTEADADERYEQQIASRQVRRYTTLNDAGSPAMAGLAIEGPDAIIDRLWNRLNAEADALYRKAGGRDKPGKEHTPWTHRLFDAACRLIDGGTGSVTGGRPTVVLTIGIEQLGQTAATQLGTGPVGNELLNQAAAGGDLAVLLTGLDGQPLWLGRARRHASSAQFLALAIRDRGCVLCGASIGRCEAHHITPWNAPARGRTDLDQLALLCSSCHRQLHERNHTLVRRRSDSGTHVWCSRPATQAETAPPRLIQRE